MDDLLVTSETEEECKKATKGLLKTLQALRYQVSANKAWCFLPYVTSLGWNLEGGKHTLSRRQISVILQIPSPENKRQVREIWEAVGHYYLWIS